MGSWHVITCEYPPMIGGVSDHSRVVAQMAAARGCEVHVWSPAGAAASPGVQVHDTLGSFGAADLARTRQQILASEAPRRLVLQWVPHGYGHRGLNVRFSRWISSLAGDGCELDVIVHEPFVDFTGGSLAQPARALIQRYMARRVLRPARRVWLAIPGWESRVRSWWIGGPAAPRVLPVPGTIPVVAAAGGVESLRRELLGGTGRRVIGYFGSGGPYVDSALTVALRALAPEPDGLRFVALGRGSGELAARIAAAAPDLAPTVRGTGPLDIGSLSHHLQACDVMLQPYADGVSGRRTTTISALEHGVPVATTVGVLSEPYWQGHPAVEVAPAQAPGSLAAAVRALLDPDRNQRARREACRLYAERFSPAVALAPLFDE